MGKKTEETHRADPRPGSFVRTQRPLTCKNAGKAESRQGFGIGSASSASPAEARWERASPQQQRLCKKQTLSGRGVRYLKIDDLRFKKRSLQFLQIAKKNRNLAIKERRALGKNSVG